MKSKSLHFKGNTWSVSALGEQAIILEPKRKEIPLSLIHETTRILEAAKVPGVVDLISAYRSIAILYDRLLKEIDVEIQIIEKEISDHNLPEFSPRKHQVPVCYEMGLDLNQVQKHTGLTKEEIIQKHIAPTYTVAMMGFIPGFIYLSGLDETITCPRKENPRTRIPAGAIGIGGNQTGLYSLESPGGWQIIGRTPNSFFNSDKRPPTEIQPGDELVFYKITEAEFGKLKNRDNS